MIISQLTQHASSPNDTNHTVHYVADNKVPLIPTLSCTIARSQPIAFVNILQFEIKWKTRKQSQRASAITVHVYTVYHYHIYQWQVETRSIRKEQPGIFCHRALEETRLHANRDAVRGQEEVFELIIVKMVILHYSGSRRYLNTHCTKLNVHIHYAGYMEHLEITTVIVIFGKIWRQKVSANVSHMYVFQK